MPAIVWVVAMAIVFRCRHCDYELLADDDLAGCKISCRSCTMRTRVPRPIPKRNPYSLIIALAAVGGSLVLSCCVFACLGLLREERKTEQNKSNTSPQKVEIKANQPEPFIPPKPKKSKNPAPNNNKDNAENRPF